MPLCLLSVERPGLRVGTPRWWPTSVAMAPMSALSTLPIEKVVRSISRTPVPEQKMSRAPGAATCSAVAAPRNSATPWAMDPASATGEVAPEIAIE